MARVEEGNDEDSPTTDLMKHFKADQSNISQGCIPSFIYISEY